MTARRGWCPSLHEPMATGDGLLLRVKPPGLLLTAAQAQTLATAATALGNGAIELTARAALQFRGFSAATAPRFAALAVAAGLACPDPAAERRRSVLVSPLAGRDPAVSPATAAIAAALSAALVDDHSLAALPAKFGFAVDGGGVLPLGDAGVDISLFVTRDACAISLAGGALAATVASADAPAAALSLAHAFLAHAHPEQRMRTAIAAIGGALFTAAHLAAAHLAAAQLAASPPRPCQPIGWHPEASALGLGLRLGSIGAPTLAALADLAARHGDATIRLTPWRAVLLAGVRHPAALAAAAALGLVVDPNDPIRRVAACPGQPACASATVATRSLAARLRPPPGATVHVSGCDKGCAHPTPATLTLVGRNGHFDLVRDGRAGDAPARRGLDPAAALQATR